MAEPLAASSYKDRSTGLIVFGIFELCLGLLCLVIAGFTFLSLTLAAQPGFPPGAQPGMASAVSPRTILPSLSIYVGMAAFLITLGIGSILARRWARALMLVFSWLWWVVGVIAILFLLFFLPDLFARLSQGGASEASVPMAAVQGCVWAALFVVYLVLPAFFVLFYRSPHVRATCEARDPRPRWTDRVPLPLLGTSLILAFGGISCLLSLPQSVVPFFGRIWTGWPATVFCLVMAVVCFTLAVATYQRRPWAWPALLVLWALGIASSAIFIWTGFDWKGMYAAMHLPTQGLEALGLDQLFRGPRFAIPVGLSALAGLVFLIWVRRYFGRPAAIETRSPLLP